MSQDPPHFDATSTALYQRVKDVVLDKKSQPGRGGRHLMPVSLAYPGNVALAETFLWDLNTSRDPALAGAAAERLGQEFNLPPQAEASLRNHIAAALEPLSAFPTDALRSERLIDIEFDIKDNDGNSVFKDTIKWNVNDVLGRMSGPETFAFTTCADLGLGPKYRAKIAEVIRTRLRQEMQKSEQQQSSKGD